MRRHIHEFQDVLGRGQVIHSKQCMCRYRADGFYASPPVAAWAKVTATIAAVSVRKMRGPKVTGTK